MLNTLTLEKYLKDFQTRIDNFLERTKVNHIVCLAPQNKLGVFWNEKKCKMHLAKSNYNKIEVKTVFLLNNHEDIDIKLQYDEDCKIEESFKNIADTAANEIRLLCEHGQNIYTLNRFFRNAIKQINKAIEEMNYISWLENHDPRNNNGFYFLITTSGKKQPWPAMELDVDTFCRHHLENNFSFRRSIIYAFKYVMVDLYSKYLLVPLSNPKFDYDCNSIDICELIFAISRAGVITESEKLKALLLDLFNISSSDYNNLSHSIRNRLKGKSVFIQKLSDQINKIKPNKEDKSKGQ